MVDTWSGPLGKNDGQENEGILDPAQAMGITTQQVDPVAGPQVVGGAASGQGRPPLEAMDGDRTFHLVIVANFMPFREYQPDGFKPVVFHERGRPGGSRSLSRGRAVYGHIRIALNTNIMFI